MKIFLRDRDSWYALRGAPLVYWLRIVAPNDLSLLTRNNLSLLTRMSKEEMEVQVALGILPPWYLYREAYDAQIDCEYFKRVVGKDVEIWYEP